MNQYMEENWKPLESAIAAKDFAAFEKAFHAAVDAANAYHEPEVPVSSCPLVPLSLTTVNRS